MPSRDERERAETKTGRVPCIEREMRKPELGGSALFIGSAQQQLSVRGDCRHVHAVKGAHLAPLTPLTGAAHARGCIRRASELRRLRGALQARVKSPTSVKRVLLSKLFT